MLETIAPTSLPRAARCGAVGDGFRRGRPKAPYATGLAEIQKANPDVAIGSYPFYSDNGPGAQLVTRGRDAEAVEQAARAIETLVKQFGVEPVRI